MYSVRDDAALPAPGCPIRESAVQRLFNTSSRLIAVVHALHRLLMPRHPPCALTILTVILLCRPPTWRPPGGRHSGRNLQHEVTDFGLQMDLPIRARDLDPELGQLCSFQGPAKGATAGGLPRPVSQNSAACVRKRLRVSYRFGRHAKDVLSTEDSERLHS